ncbi:hypothetical protein HK103_003985 [Boothiomyces macroporosus]|uniref:N-acetylglucosaminylphosphatidylinositol deacetylase n=1 Tax=Boothiomyces macroporosus TaxID=261099 RepID=A0AAD5Y8P1_9FUNG|nr:hypothetical protein HK103_003985 [Boothiomyces macroporosus]
MLIYISVILILPLILWTVITTTKPQMENQEILLVTAHPDDECMFFSPAIIQLSKTNNVHVLCLSVGNDQGLGKTREKELIKSCSILGIKNVLSTDDPELQDGMQIDWKADAVLKHFNKYVSEHNISTVITFDHLGISGHINHRKIHTALKLAKISQKLYSLHTIPVIPKFSFLISALLTKAEQLFAPKPNSLYFFASMNEYLQGRKAMYAHDSQLVWFRHLYLLSSSYMLVNRLDLEE